MNIVHDQHVHFNDMFYHLLNFMPYTEPPMDISSVGSFPMLSGGSLTPAPLGVAKLSLYMQNLLHTHVRCSLRILACWQGIWVIVYLAVCLYICISLGILRHLYICLHVHMSVVMFVHPLVHLTVHL